MSGGFALPYDDLADPEKVADAYGRWVQRTGYAASTKRTYAAKSRAFLTWVAQHPAHVLGEVLTSPHERNFAVRDYRDHLTAVGAPASVDSALAVVDSLLEWVGVGRAEKVERVSPKQNTSPESLTPEQTKAVLRAAEKRGIRDLTIVAVGFFVGLRVSELAGLNLDQVHLPLRGESYATFAGKRGRIRTVWFDTKTRELLREWTTERLTYPRLDDDAERALFLSREGRRISPRTVHHLVVQCGRAAGIVDLHPHVLRHTAARRRLERGEPITDVQVMLGHASVRTTQIYTQPTKAQMSANAERAALDW